MLPQKKMRGALVKTASCQAQGRREGVRGVSYPGPRGNGGAPAIPQNDFLSPLVTKAKADNLSLLLCCARRLLTLKDKGCLIQG